MDEDGRNRAWRLPLVAALLSAAAAGVALWRHAVPTTVLATLAAIAATFAFVAARRDTQQILRARVAEADGAALKLELAQARADREALASDMAQLGAYGNMLLESTDLAEALQISQQALSRLLPGSAGSFYPLIDGEGLSEATQLWGTHAGDTKPQATWNDCRALGTMRLHEGRSDDPHSLCAHVATNGNGHAPYSTACIPLHVQAESLGWLYVSAPGLDGIPKLRIAEAAAEQLAQALANLRLRQNLRDLSVRDPLTGLFNRRYLAESLGREMARSKRRGLPLTVMMLDLDHFKDFNDNFGHDAGDQVLVAFARLIGSSFRGEDIACRLGGEEFVVIMPEMDRVVAARRAEEILAQTRAISIVHEGRSLPPVTVSIGVAMFPEHGTRPEELMRLADEAVYRAKAGGRDRAEFAGAAQAGSAA